MLRIVLAIAALGLGIGAILAHPRDIGERRELMKRSGEQAKIGGLITRGDIPFDLAKAQVIFAVFAEKAAKLPGLFPEDSKSGDTRARPAIWEKPEEWKAAIDKFAADTKEARAQTTDLETFKAAFLNVSRNCLSCHETFRGPPRHPHK
jgi:cytochrome c556